MAMDAQDYPFTLFHKPAVNRYTGEMIALGRLAMRGDVRRYGLAAIRSGAPV
jgi:hypothetical protein